MADIFKISKDKTRANNLLDMVKEREEKVMPVLPRDLPYKILEEYYEIIVQLLTGIMYADGYKTLSHIHLIEYLSKNHKELSNEEKKIMDSLRKLRHGTMYYGKKVGAEFLLNQEEFVLEIIKKLKDILEVKVK
jgi:hypothetical protein